VKSDRQKDATDAELDLGSGSEATGSGVTIVDPEPTPLSPLFHFARAEDWEAAQACGEYLPSEFAEEGFIHCATETQVAGVIKRHLRGTGPRVRLRLDPRALRDQLKWEWSAASHDLYPHLFAAIPLQAVLQATPFDPDAV
jgi:uncharacterized protein (DUF952 family)